MRQNTYQTVAFQEDDLVFGFRPSDQQSYNFFGVGSGGSATNDITVSIVLDKADVLALDNAPLALITPPEGYGIQTTAPIAMIVNNDGTPFAFSSGETIEITNTSLSSATIASFGEPSVTSEPISSSSMIFSYDVIVDSPLRAQATFAITGGGDNATITFIIRYRLLSVQ